MGEATDKATDKCLLCGYSLKAIAADGPCPECGAVPLPGDTHCLLATGSREYLAHLRRGTALLAIAGLAAPIVAGGSLALPELGLIDDAIATTIGKIMLLVMIVMVAAGSWEITVRDTRFRTADELHHARRLARPTMLWLCCALFLQIALTFGGGSIQQAWAEFANWLPGTVHFFLALLFAATNFLAIVVAWVYVPIYLRELALRGDNAPLARTAVSRIWQLPLGLFLMGLAGMLEFPPKPIAASLQATVIAGLITWLWTWPALRFWRMMRRF